MSSEKKQDPEVEDLLMQLERANLRLDQTNKRMEEQAEYTEELVLEEPQIDLSYLLGHPARQFGDELTEQSSFSPDQMSYNTSKPSAYG